MGELTPILLQSVVPGDTFNVQSQQMIRFAPMVAPVMHRINVYTHYFFVPNRLLWANWEDFITGGEDGTSAPSFPVMPLGNIDIGSLGDHLGLPCTTLAVEDEPVSALPIAAYNFVWNEYYRDQNLQDKKVYKLIDGSNDTETDLDYNQDPAKRAWEHDYFTSCLPFAQKGDEVTVPLGDTADLVYKVGGPNPVHIAGSSSLASDGDIKNTSGVLTSDPSGSNPINVNIDVTDNHEVDLSTATASSINDLRRAFKVQEWLERNARGGSRYIEQILAHFGVRSSDARLQRPEYLGGGKSPVLVSDVVQNSASLANGTPQGNLAGKALNTGQSNNFSRTFEEHGQIIGIMSVMPVTAYQQGIPNFYTKLDKLDYLFPSFASLGEQPVKNKELYFTGDGTGADNETFGYLPRYSEYRFNPSTVHGDFKETLQYWHMSRIFANRPHLNSDFIECNPTNRIFAVQNLPEDENPVALENQ